MDGISDRFPYEQEPPGGYDAWFWRTWRENWINHILSLLPFFAMLLWLLRIAWRKLRSGWMFEP
jgi:hypothetical protein